jgi:hypothetical protein
MMPKELAGETTQSHRSLSEGRLDNVPSSTVKWVCKFDGRVVMARVHAFTSDSSRLLGVDPESACPREIRMKWGNTQSGPGIVVR